MATVADQLATFKKIPNGEAQEYFVDSKFDLNPIGSWSYGCYGQIRPFRKGRVSFFKFQGVTFLVPRGLLFLLEHLDLKFSYLSLTSSNVKTFFLPNISFI